MNQAEKCTKKIGVLILVSLLLSSCAQSGATLLNALAKTDDYTRSTNITYGAYQQNKLDIYRPKLSPNKKIPVIVFFYGGCWGECNPLHKSDYLFVAQSFASRGYLTVIPDFRQYPEVNFTEIMLDTSNVIRWLSENIAEYGGDPNRMIVVGHSSGAHIASMLALNGRYLEDNFQNNIRGFIGLAGPYDFLPLDEAYLQELFGSFSHHADSQPVNFLSSQSPPLLILHGVKDTTVGKHNAINLARKAQSLEVSRQLILYQEHNHAGILLALSRPFQRRSSVLQDMLNFIQQHTK